MQEFASLPEVTVAQARKRAIRDAMSSTDVTSVESMLSRAKTDMQVYHAAKRRRVAADDAALIAWRMDEGRVKVESTLAALPTIVPLSKRLTAVPATAEGTSVIELLPKSGEFATVTKFLDEAGAGSNFQKCSRDDWRGKHQPIMHSECPSLSARRKRKKPACSDVGVCIECTAAGRELYCLRCRFYQVTKPAFVEHMELIDDRRIVLKLVGTRDAITEEFERDLAERCGKPVDAVHLEYWWHIGKYVKSPISSCFKEFGVHAPLALGDVAVEASPTDFDLQALPY